MYVVLRSSRSGGDEDDQADMAAQARRRGDCCTERVELLLTTAVVVPDDPTAARAPSEPLSRVAADDEDVRSLLVRPRHKRPAHAHGAAVELNGGDALPGAAAEHKRSGGKVAVVVAVPVGVDGALGGGGGGVVLGGC